MKWFAVALALLLFGSPPVWAKGSGSTTFHATAAFGEVHFVGVAPPGLNLMQVDENCQEFVTAEFQGRHAGDDGTAVLQQRRAQQIAACINKKAQQSEKKK